MDVVFWYSNEPNWGVNLDRLKSVAGNLAYVWEHCGTGRSKRDNLEQIAVTALIHYGMDTPFILVEGDNWVFDNFVELLSRDTPTKLVAQSPYGFAYEHGGIKITTANQILQAIKRASTEHDISVYFNLPTDSSVAYSRHSFDTTLLDEFVIAGKEIIKLYWWGNEHLLGVWKSTPKSKRICDAILKHVKSFNYSVIGDAAKTRKLLEDIFYEDFLNIAVLGIAKNEEAHIARYMSDCTQLGKIFILDTGSTDRTIEMCGLAQEVFTQNFDEVNYSEFRNALQRKVESRLQDFDFVIWLDIDESPDFSKCSPLEFKKFLAKQPSTMRIFEFTRSDISGAPPQAQMRIFRSPIEGKWKYQIHEQFTMDDHNRSHLPVLSPLFVDHLESERIQLFDKVHRYRELITKNFFAAEGSGDGAAIFHYLFFYVDVISHMGDTKEMIRVFDSYVKSGKNFEFAQWYLRKFIVYFECLGDDELVRLTKEVIHAQYPQHEEYILRSHRVAQDVLVNGSPYSADVNTSGFRRTENNDDVVQLKIRLDGKISKKAEADIQEFNAKLIGFCDRNFKSITNEISFDDHGVSITADFVNSPFFYQFFGAHESLLVLFDSMIIAIRHDLRRTVGSVRK